MSYAQDDEAILANIPVPFDYGSLDSEINDHYIDAAKCFITKLDEIIYLLLKKEQDGRAHVKTAVWALALALGSKHLEGQSMTDIAEHLGVTRAAVSKQAVLFSKALDLPASPYMAPSRKSYGKESKLKKAARLAESVVDREYGVSVVQLTQDIIKNNIVKFKEYRSKGPRLRECWGTVVRGKSDLVQSVFIKNQYIEKLFNGTATKTAIVKAWRDSGMLISGTGQTGISKALNSSVLRGVDGEVFRGYIIKYDNILNNNSELLETGVK